jgi:hypothetical protein
MDKLTPTQTQTLKKMSTSRLTVKLLEAGVSEDLVDKMTREEKMNEWASIVAEGREGGKGAEGGLENTMERERLELDKRIFEHQMAKEERERLDRIEQKKEEEAERMRVSKEEESERARADEKARVGQERADKEIQEARDWEKQKWEREEAVRVKTAEEAEVARKKAAEEAEEIRKEERKKRKGKSGGKSGNGSKIEV